MSRWLPRRRRAVGPPSDHVVTLVTRVGCHLCDDADATLTALAAELGFTLVRRDLDADVSAAEKAQWADLVPVVLVDGVQHGYWRVEPARLRLAVGAPQP